MEPEAIKETPRLSYSIAHILNTKTPAHAYSAHRLLGGEGTADTKAMSAGRLMERFVLGTGIEGLAIVDAANWQTKIAKEARDNAIANGLEPVLMDKLQEAKANSEIILRRFREKGIELHRDLLAKEGIEVFTQLKLTWTSAEGVECSGVLDRLILNHKTGYADIQDLKTSSDLSTKALQRSVFNYGYHIQANSYEEAVGICYPAFLGRIRTNFLFCETETPFCVRVMPLAGSMNELGRRAWDEAKTTWKTCTESGEWPGYSDERIEATAWMLAEALDAQLAGGDFETVQLLGGIK